MFAADGISLGGLLNWKLDTGDGRVYSIDAAAGCQQQTILDFLCSPGRAASVPWLFSTLCFGSCLTSLVLGGVCQCRNCTARLTRWRIWPVPFTTRLLLRSERPFLHLARCRFPPPLFFTFSQQKAHFPKIPVSFFPHDISKFRARHEMRSV